MFNNRLCKITLFFIAIWVTKVSCAQGVAPNKQDGCLSMKTLESLVHVPAENAWYEFLSDEGYSSYVKDTIITDTVDFFPLRYRRTDYFFDGNLPFTDSALLRSSFTALDCDGGASGSPLRRKSLPCTSRTAFVFDCGTLMTSPSHILSAR